MQAQEQQESEENASSSESISWHDKDSPASLKDKIKNKNATTNQSLELENLKVNLVKLVNDMKTSTLGIEPKTHSTLNLQPVSKASIGEYD